MKREIEDNESDDDREECKYGAKCFRQNPEHLTRFKHPAKKSPKKSPSKAVIKKTKKRKKNDSPPSMDDDCVPEENLELAPLDDDSDCAVPEQTKTSDIMDSSDSEEEDAAKNLPPCKFGANCYRKNLLHFSEFSHPIKATHKAGKGEVDGDDDIGASKKNGKQPAKGGTGGTWDIGSSEDDDHDTSAESSSSVPMLKRSYSSLTEQERRDLIASALLEKKKLQKQLEQKSKEVADKDAELEAVKKKLHSGGIPLLDGEAEALQKTELTYFELKAKRTNENTPAEMHFRLAESQFYRLMPKGGTYSITKVDYVVAPALVKAFNSARSDLTNKRSEEMAKPVLAFHGTAEANIIPICENGFKIPGQDGHTHTTDTGWYGKGVYFSEYPNYSMGYIKGAQKLLLCQVLLGKVYKCPSLIHGQPLKTGNDCHMSPCGKELVIFNKHHILPSYIVYYSNKMDFSYDEDVLSNPTPKVVSKPSSEPLSSIFQAALKTPSSGCLVGQKFVLCGKLSSHHQVITKLIQSHGGEKLDKVDTKTNALLTSDDTSKQSSKVAYASKLNVPVVSERYLYDCINQKKVLASDMYATAKKAFAIPALGGVTFPSAGFGGGGFAGFGGGGFG